MFVLYDCLWNPKYQSASRGSLDGIFLNHLNLLFQLKRTHSEDTALTFGPFCALRSADQWTTQTGVNTDPSGTVLGPSTLMTSRRTKSSPGRKKRKKLFSISLETALMLSAGSFGSCSPHLWHGLIFKWSVMTLPKNNIRLLIPAYFFTLFISMSIHLVIWCITDSWRKSQVELISSLIAEKMESAVNTLGPRMIRLPNGCRQLKRG